MVDLDLLIGHATKSRFSQVARTPTTCLYPRSAATQTPVQPAPAMNKFEVIWKQVMIQVRIINHLSLLRGRTMGLVSFSLLCLFCIGVKQR
jgi:hypothetical protein